MTLLRSLAAVLPLLLLFLVPVLVPKKAQTETLLEAKTECFYWEWIWQNIAPGPCLDYLIKACHASTDLYLTILCNSH